MASPQVENGFTRIANEIFDHLALPGINGSEYRISIFVIRKTYGFNKKKDKISLTQFQKGTLMDRKQVVETIKSLVGKRILLKEGNSYVFNKNWEEWVVGKRPPSGQKTTTLVGKSTPEVVGKSTHTKDSIKDTNTKDILAETSSAGIGEIINNFKDINPSYQRFFPNTTQRKAAARLIETHGLEKVLKVLAVLPKVRGMPYFPTITTPLKLEEKWADLETAFIRLKNEKGKRKIYV